MKKTILQLSRLSGSESYLKTSCAIVLICALFIAFAAPGSASETEPAVEAMQLFLYKAQNHYCRDCWNMMTVSSQEALVKRQYDHLTEILKEKGKPIPSYITPEKLKARFAAGRTQDIYDFWENTVKYLTTLDGKTYQYQVMEHGNDRWRLGVDSGKVYTIPDIWVEKHGDQYLLDLTDYWQKAEFKN